MSELLPSGAPSKQFDPSSKFQVLGRGDLLPPACCASCGGSDPERRYLDLRIWHELDGQVYLCIPCVNDVAETCGLLNETEIEFLQNQNKEIAENYAELQKRYEEADERLKHFDALIGDRFNSHPDLGGSASVGSPEVTVQGTEASPELNESSSSEVDPGTLRTERSDTSNGGLDL